MNLLSGLPDGLMSIPKTQAGTIFYMLPDLYLCTVTGIYMYKPTHIHADTHSCYINEILKFTKDVCTIVQCIK